MNKSNSASKYYFRVQKCKHFLIFYTSHWIVYILFKIVIKKQVIRKVYLIIK
jgi:hypothetical protein